MTIVPDHRIIEVAPGKPVTVDPSTPIYFRKLEGGPHTIAIASENTPTKPDSDEDSEPKILTSIVKTSPKVFEYTVLQGPPQFVFRNWPWVTNPGKAFIVDRQFRGKRTPNGAAWGASVFDFYIIELLPSTWVVTTGSKLLEWAENSEEEMACAKDEIEWVRREEDPRVIEPYALGMFLGEQEENIRSRKQGWGVPMPMDWDLLLTTIGRPEKVCSHPRLYSESCH
jgi:hypothetical protein